MSGAGGACAGDTGGFSGGRRPSTGHEARWERALHQSASGRECHGRTLEVVGEKWTMLILREVWYGSSRFSDFVRVLGCPRNLLATRLRMLVEEGILATETYKEPGARSRPKYVITSKGMDLVPAVMGLLQWGDRYRADAQGPAVLARHRECGAHVGVQIRCERGHAVQAEDIESVPGPAFRMRSPG
ncbi:winged helix-turn-helix transcriptional regulator [Streptomyces europaeiscabiei]|uniref:winged helix-turn-helix transcriptional regulator n=1 Tax=Streptomyces europaeiscabiei TaxID=146819 RepID=UPI000B124347|nr:helix-turn-helix domain-containing protein [Streptomyces europaeiscabiei]MDX3665607.1 helix-turn-helix domain-containing protein [Streptomyces europaeiscabiei]